MGKFDGILICTDLDGTLLKNDKTVSEKNLEAIRYFMSEGGKFTFITGRMHYFMGKIRDTVPTNAPIGCANGGAVYDCASETYLRLRTLPQDVYEVVEYITEQVQGIGVIVNTADKLYFPYDNSATERHRFLTGMPYATADLKTFDKPIAKIVFADEREAALLRAAELLNTHPRADEFNFIRSEKSLYEINTKGNTKGSVMLEICDICGIDRRRSVALGDYDNDVSMLRAAGVGVAVGNASANAKAAADRVTVTNEEDAIARVISDIESGEIRFAE